MFSIKKDVIYSKRYHFEKEMEKILHAATPPMDEESQKKMNDQFDDLMRQCREAAAYVAKPGAEQKEKQFIEQAKQLSEECEIDMGITRYPGYVSVVLYLFYLPLYSDFTSKFSLLVGLSDYMNINPAENEPSDVRITLDLHTHDCYMGGKKILF